MKATTKQNNRMQIDSMQLTIPCARRRHFYNLRHSGYLTPLVSGSGKTKNCGRKWREFVVHVAVVGASSRLV